MSGRSAYNQHNSADLLGLDEQDGPVYNDGQPPPVSDERMLHDYDIETSDDPRVSVSHDDFVGASQVLPVRKRGAHGDGSGPAGHHVDGLRG